VHGFDLGSGDRTGRNKLVPVGLSRGGDQLDPACHLGSDDPHADPDLGGRIVSG
jgi:hypothetical protein